jgi:hypothetical protein
LGLTIKQIENWVREIQQSRSQRQSLVTPEQYLATVQWQDTRQNFRDAITALNTEIARIPTYDLGYPRIIPIQNVSNNVAERPINQLSEADRAFLMVARAQTVLRQEGKVLSDGQTFFHGKNYGMTQNGQVLDIVRTGTYLPLVSYANGQITLHEPLNQSTDTGILRRSQQELLTAKNPIQPDVKRGFELS